MDIRAWMLSSINASIFSKVIDPYLRTNLPQQIYKYIRSRGFTETLNVLANCPNGELHPKEFFNLLSKEEQSYYNAFLRTKKDLLRLGLIKYKLDENTNKVLYITEKGRKIQKLIAEIEKIISEKSK
jgi:hypothetical protein